MPIPPAEHQVHQDHRLGPPGPRGVVQINMLGLVKPRPTNIFRVGWSGIHVQQSNIFDFAMFRLINMHRLVGRNNDIQTKLL